VPTYRITINCLLFRAQRNFSPEFIPLDYYTENYRKGSGRREKGMKEKSVMQFKQKKGKTSKNCEI